MPGAYGSTAATSKACRTMCPEAAKHIFERRRNHLQTRWQMAAAKASARLSPRDRGTDFFRKRICGMSRHRQRRGARGAFGAPLHGGGRRPSDAWDRSPTKGSSGGLRGCWAVPFGQRHPSQCRGKGVTGATGQRIQRTMRDRQRGKAERAGEGEGRRGPRVTGRRRLWMGGGCGEWEGGR